MGYIFDSHYGTSSLADEETRLVIEWDNGNYDKVSERASVFRRGKKAN